MTADTLNGSPPGRSAGHHDHAAAPWQRRLLPPLFRSPLYRAWLRRAPPDGIAWIPPLLAPGSAERANAMFQGRYTFAGHAVQSVNDAPWRQADTSPDWLMACHEFGWLADFAAADGATARKQARELVRRWAIDFGAWSAVPWSADTLGLRLLAWLTHADFLLVDAEPDFSDIFLRTIGEQTRHLARAQTMEQDVVRRTIARACSLATGVALGRRPTWARGLQHLLDDATLIAGGKATRCPEAWFRTLAPLLVLREALRADLSPGHEPLDAVIADIGNMVRLTTHGDGGLAVIQGGHEGDTAAIAALLDRPGAEPQVAGPGIARLQQGRLLIIAETDQPGGSAGHASTLAIEVSVGKQRLFVNCGAPDNEDPAWQKAAQATAAHTTLVIDDHNQDRGMEPPTTPGVLRGEERDSTWLELSSDAYAQGFGVRLSRRLHVAKDGHELVGEDQVSRALDSNEASTPAATTLCARYHLHPRVTASLVGDGRQVLLGLGNGTGWVFEAADSAAALEDSVYFGEWGRAQRTRQIVLSRRIKAGACRLVWHLMRVDGRT